MGTPTKDRPVDIRSEDWREAIRQQILTLKVVVAGMISGPATLWAVVLLSRGLPQEEPQTALRFLPWLAALLGALGGVLAYFWSQYLIEREFRRLVKGTWKLSPLTSKQVQTTLAGLAEKLGDPGRLWAIYSLGFFVRVSVLEGIATLSAVLYAMVPSWIPVAVAAMVLLAIVGNYPTWLGVSEWMAQRLARLEQERAMHALSAAHLASGATAAPKQ
jgi:sterol desaturase/sphingolipid hydroxylase (fatty acid hydroxylase superfamily)